MKDIIKSFLPRAYRVLLLQLLWLAVGLAIVALSSVVFANTDGLVKDGWHTEKTTGN